jgi:hypothetical protein
VNRREFFRTSALAGATLSVHSGLDQHAIAEPARPSPKPETLTPEYFGQAELAAESRLLKAGFAERDIAPARGMQMMATIFPIL